MLANGMTMTDEDRNSTRSLINQSCVDDYAVRPKNKRGSVSSIPLSIDLMLEEESGGEDVDASPGEKEEQTENSQPDRSKDQGERKSRRRISQVSLDSGLERDSHDGSDFSSKPHPPAAYEDRLRQARQLIAQRTIINSGQSESSNGRKSRVGKGRLKFAKEAGKSIVSRSGLSDATMAKSKVYSKRAEGKVKSIVGVESAKNDDGKTIRYWEGTR
jgi:hypothetical protein